jgi:hypothetical protein
MEQFLSQDSNMAFNVALWNNLAGSEAASYIEICGDFYSAVCQWASHNIYYVHECQNDKFTGWTLVDSCSNETKVYVPNWVMDAEVKDWKHAKNLFSRHLKVAR